MPIVTKMETEQKRTEKIELPEKVSASYQNLVLKIKGEKGEVQKTINEPGINIKTDNNAIIIEYSSKKKKTKKLFGTLKAHINNLIHGASTGYVYKMKICSGHFPMTVTVTGNELVIKNFFGEKAPRKLKLNSKVKVKVDGQEISIESSEKESASQCAAAIEQLTKRSNFDRRIFMDGIYITSKVAK